MKPKHLIFSLLAMFASFSAKAANGDTFTVSIGDGNSRMTLKVLSEANRTIEVSSVSDNDVTAATIASTYTNGETEYTVVSIGNFAFLDKDNLIELNLPNTVTRIGIRAFKGCTALGALGHTFTIPSSVTTIETEAFYNCGFVSGSIPASVTSVGPDAFYGTGWLQNQADGIVYINNILYTYKGTMPASSSLTVADGTTRIINGAFKNQENLEAITLPSTLTAVESYAFSGCSNLTSVTVDATTPPTCPADAFSNAANATLYVPYGLVETYQAATGWKNFSEIRENLESPIVFKDAEFKAICIANWDTNNDRELSYAEAAAVTSVGSLLNTNTITYLDELQYFTGLTTINKFTSCSKLKSIYIPKNISDLNYGVFTDCFKLKKVVFCDSEDPLTISGSSVNNIFTFTTQNHYSIDSLYIGRDICGVVVTYSSSPGVNLKYVALGKDVSSETPMNRLLGYEKSINTISISSINQCGLIDGIPRVEGAKFYIKDEFVEDVIFLEGTISIGGFSNMSIKSVTIPSSVTTIRASAFKGCVGLTSVTIPNSVTTIGDSAFEGCIGLTSVTIPNGVTSIGTSAFNDCPGLVGASITIPSSVISIGGNAFNNSYIITIFANTTPITYTGGIGYRFIVPDDAVDTYKTAWPDVADKIFGESDYALKSCTVTAKASSSALLEAIGGEDYTSRAIKLKISGTINSYDMMIMRNKMINLTELDLSDATIVANSYNYGTGVSEDNVFPDFLKGKKLTSIILPNTITSIGQNAFNNCIVLSSITIPASVTSIGSSAFSGASRLKSIEFAPSSQLTTIGGSAFQSSGLSTFITPTSLQSIGPTAFANCSALTSFTFSEGMRTIGSYAFEDCSALTTIIFKEGVTSIGDFAFKDCASLSSITFPQSLTTLGRYAFYYCTNLQSITVPSVQTIDTYTFQNCTALKTVKLSPQTTTIKANAFYYCTALEEIHLPPYLNNIEDKAFLYCGKLKTIYAYMPDIVTIGSSTFPNMATASLYVPAFLYNSYYYDTNWSQFLHVQRCDLQPGDYAAFYTNGDIIFEQGEQRITEDTPIAEIGNQGGVIVEGEAQQFDTVDQTVGDYSSSTATSASLIGDGETAQANNLPMNELRVNIPVTAKKWYFFCFPFNVTIENCTYPGRYVWRYYDGATRAANGSGGWKTVSGETLTAKTGYAFQSETAGTLVVKFSNPTFGGNRAKTLEAYAAQNAQHASWNLVGNPYSSYYDFRSEDITSPVTIWNGSSYVAYRPGDDECHLRPYEAFFIQKPNAADQISFNAGRRETYRQSERTKSARQVKRRENGITPERRLINLEIMSDTLMLDRTRVVLNQKAQRAYELECDAAKFMSDEAMAQLYSVEGGIQMAINERPLDGDIRLGYTAKKSGRLSISALRMDLPMVLVDTKKNITFDLSVGTYDFDTQAGTFNDRFILRLGGEATAINNLAAKTGVCIGTQEGGIAIGGAEGKTVNVYTTGGALAAQHSGNGFIALKNGIYVVSVDGVSAKVSVK